MEKNHKIEFWFKKNKNVLEHLYYYLIDLCNKYKLKLIDSPELRDSFIRMMYNESLKNIVDKNLYPEYFDTAMLG
jgi:hypothetical protein